MYYLRSYHKVTLGDIPGASDLNDLVQSAISDLLSGNRKLPDDPSISILTAVLHIARSKGFNERRKRTVSHKTDPESLHKFSGSNYLHAPLRRGYARRQSIIIN